MSTIDNRIVEMQFNNRRFEKNAKETMSTLDKLKEKLKFKDSTRELQEFQNASDSFNLSHIANAVDQIGDKFTLLGNIGQRAMQRIADSAIDTSTRLLKSISIDQISQGFSKYEQETNIVQTLYGALKPKGTKLDEIYEVLETLTSYSDETSYSYSQMADAVSKFVNAGVDLKKSETVIEGISNAAALAGIGIHDTAIIYRNFADAIGKGGFKLQDWNSIKTAHMDTEWLKQAFVDQAIAMGALDKSGRVMVKAAKTNKKGQVTQEAQYKSAKTDFEGSLSSGWLSTAVINATMMKYANRELEGFGKEAFAAAQNAKTFTDVLDAVKDAASTGWARSFRIIFGDLEEAIDLFTPMANAIIEVVNGIDEARNTLLGSWKDAGGRDNMIGALTSWWESFKSISGQFKWAITDVFGKTFDKNIKLATANKKVWERQGVWLNIWTLGIRQSAEAFQEWLKGTNQFSGKQRITIFRDFFGAIIGGINSAIVSVRTFVSAFKMFMKDQIGPILDAVLAVIQPILHDLNGFFKRMKTSTFFITLAEKFAAALKPIASRLPKIILSIGDLYKRIKKFWKENKRFVAFRETVEKVFWAFLDFIPKVIESLIQFGKGIVDTVKNSDEWKTLEKNYNKYVKPLVGRIADTATKFGESLTDFFEVDTSDEETMWGKIKKRFSAFDELGPWLSDQWDAVKKDLPWLQKVEDWFNTSPIIKEIRNFAFRIRWAFSRFVNADVSDANGIWERLKKRFEAAWPVLKNYFDIQIKRIKKWMKSKWDELAKNNPWIEKLGSWFESTGITTKVEGIKQKLLEVIGKLFRTEKSDVETPNENKSFFAKIKEWLTNGFTDLSNWFSQTWNKLKTKFAFVNEIKDYIFGLFAPKGNEETTNGNIVERVQTVGDALAEVITPVLDKIKTWAQSLTLKDVYLITKVIAGVIAIVSLIKKLIQFKLALAPFKELIDSLTDTIEQYRKNLKAQKFKNMGIAAIAFAGAIWLLIKAVERLGEMPVEIAITGFIRLGILAAGLVAAMAIMNKAGENGKGGTTDLFGFKPLLTAIGMAILLKTFVKVYKQLKDADPDMVTAVAIWCDAITVMLGAVLAMDSGSGGTFKPLLTAIGMAILIRSFAKAVQGLSAVPTKSLILAGLLVDSISGLLIGLIAISKDMELLDIVGLAVAFAGMVILINTFKGAIEQMKDVDPAVMLAFSGSIAILSVCVAGLIALGKRLGPSAIEGALVMAASLVILAEGLNLAGGAIASLFDSVAIIGAQLAQFSDQTEGIDTEHIKSMLALLLEMAETLAVMALYDYGGLDTFHEELVRIGASIRLFDETTSGVDTSRMQQAIDFASDSASSLALIGLHEYGRIDAFRTNLSHLGSGIRLFQNNVQNANFEQMKGATTVIKEIAEDLSAFPDVADVSTSIGNIGGAIKLYADSVDGVSLDNAPDMSSIKLVFDTLKDALPNDDNLSDVAAYASDEKGNEMTNFAIGLTNIATAVHTFSDHANEMNFDNIDKAIAALTAIKKLDDGMKTTTVAQFGPFALTVKSQNEGDALSNFAENVTLLGTAVGDFGDGVKNTNFDNVEKAIEALTAISKLNDAFTTTSVVHFGPFALELKNQKDNLATFSEDIVLLGASLKDFGENLSGVDVDKVTAGATALGVIATINEHLPQEGGISSWFTGKVSLSRFAANLRLLGGGAKAFSESISGEAFNAEQVGAAGEALIKIAEVNKKLPKTGGISSWFTGDESLSGFGDSLEKLGKGIKKFVEALGSTTIESGMTEAIDLINRVATIQIRLGNAQSWYSMGYFGDELASAAESLIAMSNTLNGVTWNDTAPFEHMLDFAVDQQSKLKNATFSKSLRNIGQDLKGFFDEIWSFTSGWTGKDNGKLDKVTSSVTEIFTVLNETFANAETNDQFAFTGESVIKSLVSGFTSTNAVISVQNAVVAITNKIVEKVESYCGDNRTFYNVGTWIPAGLANGIRSNQNAVVNAVIDVMNAAISAAQATAEISSPSRVFAEMGMYMDQGLANGMLNYVRVVDEASKKVSQNAISTVLQDMMAIENLPLDEIEIRPQIRPVLDTSDISSKAGLIDGLLGGNRTIDFNTRKLEAQAQLLGEANGLDLGTITQRVNDLNDKLTELKDVVGNMRIVLNNGVLVGALASDIDKALGAKARLGERGG